MPDESGDLKVKEEMDIGGGKYAVRIESVSSSASGQAINDAKVSVKIKDNKADCFLTREEQLFLQERSILQTMLNQNENSRMASFRWSLSVAAIFVVAALSKNFDLSGYFYLTLVVVILLSLVVIELRNQFLYLRIKQRAEAVEGFFAGNPDSSSNQLTPIQIEPIFIPKDGFIEKCKESWELINQPYLRLRFLMVFLIEVFLFVIGAVALGFLPSVSDISERFAAGKMQSVDVHSVGKWRQQAKKTVSVNGCNKTAGDNLPLQLTVASYKNNFELYETVCENGEVKSVKCYADACAVEKTSVMTQ